MRKPGSFNRPSYEENAKGANHMKLGIGVQTPDFISPYFSINAAKA